MIQDVHVTGLWIYPIKSCQGISLSEMKISNTGPAFDRQFMIVDSSNHFITLRTENKLAGIHTKIRNESLEISFLDYFFCILLTVTNRLPACAGIFINIKIFLIPWYLNFIMNVG